MLFTAMLEHLSGKGLIIHHWDTDGICSAALLLQRLGASLASMTPTLGNYFLTADERAFASGFDYTIIADMALPEDDVRQLATHATVLIFDHHLQLPLDGVFHHNPVGSGASPEVHPSASWIINTYLGNELNLWAVLGAVGDHEHRITHNATVYPRIDRFCTEQGLSLDQLLSMVQLLDSSYKLGDKTAVEAAPRFLLQHPEPDALLSNMIWKNNLTLLEEEISYLVNSSGEDRGRALLKFIQTKRNIISTVTRRIFWQTGKDTVVVNTGFFPDRDQVYIRSSKNLQPLIAQGKALGCRCGGKAEVMGAIVDKGTTQKLLRVAIEYLSN